MFAALQSFEEQQALAGEEPSLFFIDQFCLDQHEMTDLSLPKDEMQRNVVGKLQKSITVPGRVLMLLHPFDKPVVLSRAWCLVSGLNRLPVNTDF